MKQVDPTHGWNSEADASEFIGALVKMTGAKTVIEVGTFQGRTALEIIKNLPEGGKAILIDIEDHRCEELKELCDGEKVRFIKESSMTALPKLKVSPDLVFIDSVHEFEHIGREVKAIEKLGNRNCIYAFHDSIHMAEVATFVKWLSQWYNVVTLPTSEGRGISIATVQ